MSDREAFVRLSLDDDFVGGMRLAAEAGRILGRDRASMQATWEPHDWQDFA